MLTTWTPAHMPEKEEIKTRLQTARSQLYDFQMKIKEHKIPDFFTRQFDRPSVVR